MPCVGGVCSKGAARPAPARAAASSGGPNILPLSGLPAGYQVNEEYEASLRSQQQQRQAQQPATPVAPGFEGVASSSAGPLPGSHEWLLQNNPHYQEQLAQAQREYGAAPAAAPQGAQPSTENAQAWLLQNDPVLARQFRERLQGLVQNTRQQGQPVDPVFDQLLREVDRGPAAPSSLGGGLASGASNLFQGVGRGLQGVAQAVFPTNQGVASSILGAPERLGQLSRGAQNIIQNMPSGAESLENARADYARRHGGRLPNGQPYQPSAQQAGQPGQPAAAAPQGQQNPFAQFPGGERYYDPQAAQQMQQEFPGLTPRAASQLLDQIIAENAQQPRGGGPTEPQPQPGAQPAAQQASAAAPPPPAQTGTWRYVGGRYNKRTRRYEGGRRVPLTRNNYERFVQALPEGHPTRNFMEEQRPTYQFAQPGFTSGVESANAGVPLQEGSSILGRVTNAVGGTRNLAALLTVAAPVLAAGATGALGALFAPAAAAPAAAEGAVAGAPVAAGTAAPLVAGTAGPAATAGTAGTAAGLGGAGAAGLGAAGVGAAGLGAGGLGRLLTPLALGAGLGAAGLAAHRATQHRARAGGDTMRFPIYTPEQEGLMNQMMVQGGQMANQLYGGNQLDFEPQAELARRAFAQRTIPTIMERYAGVTGGGQRSNALPQQLTQAGQDLEAQLAALRSKYGLQSAAIKQGGIGQLLGAGLQPRFETAFTPKPPSLGTAFGQGIGQSVGLAPAMLLQSLFR